MKLINHFFKDKNTPSLFAKIGYGFGTLVKWLGMIAFVLLFVAMGQFSQYDKSYGDFRLSLINEWASDSKERKHLAKQFINKCLMGKQGQNKLELPIKPAVTITACGEQIGASELASYVISKNKVFHSVAWPLSLFDAEPK